MKRMFDELSDDECAKANVKVSRVLGPSRNGVERDVFSSKKLVNGVAKQAVTSSGACPPLESFAFRLEAQIRATETTQTVEKSVNLTEDDDSNSVKERLGARRRRFIVVDESSDDEFDPLQGRHIANTSPVAKEKSPDDHIADDEAIAQALAEDEQELAIIVPDPQAVVLEASNSSEDLIDNTLQKCDEIAALLRKELRLTNSDADRYAEVEASAAKIVSQVDVCAACGVSVSNLQQVLKPYQLVGVNFLLLLYRKKVGGAILADEMGLGKTIQAIAFLALLNYLEKDSGPHLVVCPASLLENWHRELKKWSPSSTVVVYHGNERSSLFKELSYITKAFQPVPFNVMLTCYSLFERHSSQQKDDRRLLKRFDWSCLLMDEAHLLKDRSSYRRKNLWALAQRAKQRLLLTGTPLQNDLQELWSLLEFMVPEIFDSGDWDLKKLFGNKGTGSDIPTDNMDLISRIKAILGPFVLRRLKSDVMRQLVPKTQKVEFLEMLPEQAAAYNEAIKEYRAAVLKDARTRPIELGSTDATSFLPRRQVSNYFTQFRKIANHPLLVRRIYSDSDLHGLAKKLHPMGVFGFECTFERVKEELMTYNDFALHKLSAVYGVGERGTLSDSYALGSAKCQALARLLPKLKRRGHRPLIFSQWTSMMDILEWALNVLGFEYSRLDGSTQVSVRQNIVDDFNNNPDIFACLLSTRAGGQGLNLTGADTVIIHDMDFNPQMDRQAEDRCHRIGQTKPVTVYRLVTKGTVDENIYDIAKRKLILDAAVLDSNIKVENDNSDGDASTMAQILATILAAAPS